MASESQGARRLPDERAGQADGSAYLTFDAVAEQRGVSLRHVRRMVNRGELAVVPIGKHTNGMVEYGVRADALGEERPLAPQPTALPVGRRAPMRDRVPLTHDGIPDVAAMRAMGLGKHADEWDRRMRIVGEFREARSQHGKSRAVARMIAHKYGECVATIYDWNSKMLRGGPAALVPAWEPGQGRTCLPADLQLQVREFYLNSRQSSVEQLYAAVVLPYYKDRGEDPPHVRTVGRYLNTHVLPLEEVFWREGRRAYQAACAPKVVRELPAEVNDWWCADHRLWDVHVVVPDGRGAGWGRFDKQPCPCGSGRERRECCSLRRPWVTLVMDITSAAIVGWRIGLVPTAAGVCHAVRSAILTCGVPAHFYRDNGKEFSATRLGGRAERLLRPRQEDLAGQDRWPCAMPADVDGSGVWSALGVEVVTALPYSAWSKPVESLFYAFSRRWENLVPGWCGRDAKVKPEQLDVQIRNGALLTWAQFEEVFAEQARKWNEEHVCGERSGPPAALYKDARVRACARETLNYLLQDVREVRVTTRGVEVQQGKETYRFYSEEIALYVGCAVTVRWDPEEPDWACVTTPDARVVALPLAADARYGEFGEANTAARRGAKLQRAFLRARAAEVAGATPPERLDPTGAVAMIQERPAEIASDRSDRLVLRSEALLRRVASDLEAAAEAQRVAVEEAKNKPARSSEPDKTVYSDDVRGIA